MRNTMIGVGMTVCAILALRTSTPAHGEPALGRKTSLRAANPCAGLNDGDLLQVEQDVKLYVRAGAAPNIVSFRDSLGLGVWPVDSVVATTDSLLCTHLDSLVSVWLATPAAGGITREPWWTSNAVARANLGKYWISSNPSPDGVYYNFVVDSARGVIHFFPSVSM